MKRIDVFVSDDGKRFDSEKYCISHESIGLKLDALFSRLPILPKDDHCKFSNGEGYIQHTPEIFTYVVSNFYDLACSYHDGLSKYPYDSYGFWRTLDDSGSIFYRYGSRLLNTSDTTFREYGQPYYKNNPNQCKGGQIN